MKKNILKLGLASSILLINSCNSTTSSLPPSSSSKERDNIAKVFAMCGQSNMEGNTKIDNFEAFCNDTSREYNNYVKFGFKKTRISYWTSKSGNYSNPVDPIAGKFRSVRLGQGFTLNHFGPEIGIAERLDTVLDEENDNPVYFIKFTKGATGLANKDEWLPPSMGGNSSSLYTMMLTYVHNNLKLIENEGYIPDLKGFLWMQGETDSGGGIETENYEANTRGLIESFREEFKDYAKTKIAFIDAAISEKSIWSAQERINQAKQNVASEKEENYYIETRANGLDLNVGDEEHGGGDIYHYNIDSMVKLGNAFADVIIDNNLLI